MYLTDKMNGHPREMDDHEELEFLLESFTKQVEEIVSEVGNIDVSPYHSWLHNKTLKLVQNNVESTQEIVELILDANRNSLLGLDLQASKTDAFANILIDVFLVLGVDCHVRCRYRRVFS